MQYKSNKSSKIQAAAHAGMLETLESRRMMSVSLDPATHVLTANGTPLNDTIVVSLNGDGRIRVSDNGVNYLFNPASVSYIVLRGYAGNDSLRGSDFVPKGMTINAGPGDDFLRGGASGDVLNGEDGNDVLDGGESADFFNGGPGYDTADYSFRTSNLRITQDNLSNDGRATGEGDNVRNDIEVVKGGFGNDEITGNAFNNILYGNGGFDLIQGLAGHDVLYGGAGQDTLDGGRLGYHPADDTGNDALYGEADNDALYASDFGNNYLSGGDGNDVLSGYHGDDTLVGGNGDDYLYGYRGNDYLLGGAGFDRMYGQDGDDYLDSKDGLYNEIVDGGLGNDRGRVDFVFSFPFVFKDNYSSIETFV